MNLILNYRMKKARYLITASFSPFFHVASISPVPDLTGSIFSIHHTVPFSSLCSPALTLCVCIHHITVNPLSPALFSAHFSVWKSVDVT